MVDKEVEKMLTDSPWSQQIRIAFGSLTERAQDRGVPATAGIPAAPVPDCGGGQFGRIRRQKVTITWSGALPIKQAIVRQAIGRDAPVPPESQALLRRTLRSTSSPCTDCRRRSPFWRP